MTTMNVINYSIIIPHKNSPEDLCRLLDSIPNRCDIQIIVVDDNSDEDKRPIADSRNVEVVLLDKETSRGAGKARNVGVKYAKGKWLLFADADDVYTCSLSLILEKYKDDDNTDIVYLNANRINERGEQKPFISSAYINNYLNNKFYSEKVLRFGMWTPWTRMVKKNLVVNNRLQFEEIPTGNDMMFSLLCSKYAKTIAAEREVVYLYFTPENRSLTELSRKKLSNIPFRIELGQRQNQLYRSVGFIFRDSNFTAYRNPPKGTDKVLYQNKYKLEMKQRNISFLSEVWSSVVNRIGILLGIIQEGI